MRRSARPLGAAWRGAKARGVLPATGSLAIEGVQHDARGRAFPIRLDELFERCLARYSDGLSTRMRTALEEGTSGRRFIEETFMAVARTAQRPDGAKGCLIANSASELGQREPALAAPVADGLGRFTRIFTDAVTRAQAAGEIPAAADPRALASYLVACMNGLRTVIKAGADRRSAKGTVKLMLRALD